MHKTLILLCGLSMAVGWRIRGQFGHEMGAAIAGALGALALVVLAGRDDWWRRAHYFAFFGALGWGFGGSISYMKVIGYCHSSDSATVLYGFAGVFLIGFLWAGLGGAGTALPAVLDSVRLGELFPAIAGVLAAWFAGDIALDLFRPAAGLNWFDSDWIPAAIALVTASGMALWRRRIDTGTSLVLYLSIGWWAGFLLLVAAAGLHLNPPRGDNWAGVLGLVLGFLLFCRRHGLKDVSKASVVTGMLGGAGFCLGQMIKLGFIATGALWGWHAVMEWFHGLFFGIALAIAMMPLVRRGSVIAEGVLPRWTATLAVFFVLWVIPYLNFRRSVPLWLRYVKSLPESPYGIPLLAGFAPSKGFIGWFDAIFVLLAAVLVVLLSRPRPQVVPESLPGRGQLLYLVLLWVVTFMSFANEVIQFNPQVMAIQWGITTTSLLCTFLLLRATTSPAPAPDGSPFSDWSRRSLALGVLLAVASSVTGWCVKRALFGDKFTGYFYMDHIRFGPNNTDNTR